MKAFSRKFISVFRKKNKRNKLKFTGKRLFTKDSIIFLQESPGHFSAGHSLYFNWDIFNNEIGKLCQTYVKIIFKKVLKIPKIKLVLKKKKH